MTKATTIGGGEHSLKSRRSMTSKDATSKHSLQGRQRRREPVEQKQDRRRPTFVVADDNTPIRCSTRRGFKLGSDFSGIFASIACKALNLITDHVFFCEKTTKVARREIIQHNYQPKTTIQGDVETRDPKTTPRVDVFFCIFPCQPFSQAGKHDEGVFDPRGLVVGHSSLEYIRQHPPN